MNNSTPIRHWGSRKGRWCSRHNRRQSCSHGKSVCVGQGQLRKQLRGRLFAERTQDPAFDLQENSTHARAHTYTCTLMCTYTHTQLQVYSPTCTHTCTLMHKCSHAHAQAHTLTCTLTHTHTHMYIHTHSQRQREIYRLWGHTCITSDLEKLR